MDDRGRLNSLGERLDQAMKARLAKEDPAYRKRIIEEHKIRRNGTPEQKKALLVEKMRSALRVGDRIRKNDRATMDLRLWNHMKFADDHNMGMTQQWKKALQEAKSRGMLAQEKTVTSDGEKKTRDLFRVEPKEPYKKRPSIRAAKKYRSKGVGGPSM